MIQKLLELPRPILVAILLTGGILLIVFANPPYTVCDSQMEVFTQAQSGFLYKNPKSKFAKTTLYQELTDRCKEANSPGGCYELFLKMKGLLSDLDHVPQECSASVVDLSEVRAALWGQITLLTQLAWGTKPPDNFHEKLKWLDPADIALFCQLKKTVEKFYGQDAYVEFRERMFQQLPGAAQLSRAQAWDMMLLSNNCAAY